MTSLDFARFCNSRCCRCGWRCIIHSSIHMFPWDITFPCGCGGGRLAALCWGVLGRISGLRCGACCGFSVFALRRPDHQDIHQSTRTESHLRLRVKREQGQQRIARYPEVELCRKTSPLDAVQRDALHSAVSDNTALATPSTRSTFGPRFFITTRSGVAVS